MVGGGGRPRKEEGRGAEWGGAGVCLGMVAVRGGMGRKGSAEAREPFMHNVVYGGFGIDGDDEDLQNGCPDYIVGPIHGANGYVFGDRKSGVEGKSVDLGGRPIIQKKRPELCCHHHIDPILGIMLCL